MVSLSQNTVEELQQIIRDEYGKDLSTQEATVIANGLISYFDLLAEIHHRSKVEVRGAPSQKEGGSGALSKTPKLAEWS